MDRLQVLSDLVSFNKSIDILSKEVTQLNWDYDGEPFVVQVSQVRAVLEGFLSNKYSVQELEDWANLVESREDLDFEERKLEEVIYTLANPVLEGELTYQSCKELLDLL